ncbi:MAG: PAS domain S-box protein, partial [Bacteroidota bacterium]
MKSSHDKSEIKAILRQRAEEILKKKQSASVSLINHETDALINQSTHQPIIPFDADTVKLVHELEVHQIELEMVIDELMLAKDQAAELAAEKYIELYNFAPTGNFTLSKDGKIIELNLSGSQMLGRERSSLINRRFDIFISEDTTPNFNLFLKKIFSGHTKETCEATISTNGNLPIFVYLTGIITQNREQCLVNMVDITRNKQAESLEQTRQNFETFFNAIDEFLFVLDEQGNIIHVNSTVVTRLGYTSEELFGKSVLMIHPPERRDEAGRIVGEMLSGVNEFCPVPIVTKSGIQIPVETRVYRGFWDGKPVIFGVTKDISQVRLSEEKFSKVFYLNPSACGLSDLDNRTYVEVNEAFYTLLGFDKNEVIGKTAADLGILTPESIKIIEAKLDKNGKANNIETQLRAKNGDIKHVMLSADNIYIQDKKYRFTVVHDITERKHAEQALKEISTRLSLATHAGGVGVWDLDIVNNILFWD